MWKLKVNCLLLQVVTKLLTFRHHGGTEASDGTAIRPFNLRWSCQDPGFVLELVVTCPHNKAVQILICLVQLPAALQTGSSKQAQISTRIPRDSEYSQVWKRDWDSSNTKSESLRFCQMVTRKTEAVFLQHGNTFLHASRSPPQLQWEGLSWFTLLFLLCYLVSFQWQEKQGFFSVPDSFPATRRTILKRSYYTLPIPKAGA